jgi:hypothetical protein
MPSVIALTVILVLNAMRRREERIAPRAQAGGVERELE